MLKGFVGCVKLSCVALAMAMTTSGATAQQVAISDATGYVGSGIDFWGRTEGISGAAARFGGIGITFSEANQQANQGDLIGAAGTLLGGFVLSPLAMSLLISGIDAGFCTAAWYICVPAIVMGSTAITTEINKVVTDTLRNANAKIQTNMASSSDANFSFEGYWDNKQNKCRSAIFYSKKEIRITDVLGEQTSCPVKKLSKKGTNIYEITATCRDESGDMDTEYFTSKSTLKMTSKDTMLLTDSEGNENTEMIRCPPVKPKGTFPQAPRVTQLPPQQALFRQMCPNVDKPQACSCVEGVVVRLVRGQILVPSLWMNASERIFGALNSIMVRKTRGNPMSDDEASTTLMMAAGGTVLGYAEGTALIIHMGREFQLCDLK